MAQTAVPLSAQTLSDGEHIAARRVPMSAKTAGIPLPPQTDSIPTPLQTGDLPIPSYPGGVPIVSQTDGAPVAAQALVEDTMRKMLQSWYQTGYYTGRFRLMQELGWTSMPPSASNKMDQFSSEAQQQ